MGSSVLNILSWRRVLGDQVEVSGRQMDINARGEEKFQARDINL